MRKALVIACAILIQACGPADKQKDAADSEAALDTRSEAGTRGDLEGDSGCCPDARGEGGGETDLGEDVVLGPSEFELFSMAPQGTLLAAWGTDDLVFAVGEKGAIIRRQGLSWTPMKSPTKKALHCVYGFGPDDVYVGGENGIILHFDGSEWTKVDTGLGVFNDVTLRGAWGYDGHLFLVGDKGTVFHTGEGKWVKEDSLSSYNLVAVWGVSLVDVYVAGAGGTVLRRIGGAWSSSQVTAGSTVLNAIHGLSSNELWTGGTKGQIVVHDSAGWAPKLSNDAYERNLHGVWAFGPKDVWFVGEEGVLVHSEQGKWNMSEIAGPYYKNHSFHGLWGRSGESNEAWAVGAMGAILHYDGVDWTDEQSAPVVDLNDVAGTGWDDVAVVGGDGLVVFFDGESWSGPDRVTDRELTAVARSGQTYLAVGKQGTVVEFAGAAAELVETDIKVSLYGVCAGAGKAAAVGEKGKLYVSADAATWDPVATGVFDTLRDCHVDEEGVLTLVGDMGRIVRVDGTASTESVATMANLHRVTRAADGSRYAVGDNGLILRDSGAGWEKLHEEPGLFLYGVHAFEDRLMAVGWAGRILELDFETQEVVQVEAPDSGVLLQIWGADRGHLFVVGKKGKMLRFVEN